MLNKENIKESFTPENLFYTALIGVFYLFGLYSIIQNIQILINYPDFDHFVFILISLGIWGLYGFVYIEKLQYFSKIKPLKDEQFLVKPKLDMEHMIWFFVQFYVLVAFYILFVQWHSTIDKEIMNSEFAKIAILFFAFIPFLIDCYKTNKMYIIIGVSILSLTFILLFIGFFEHGCYVVNDFGIREYLVDCLKN